MDKLKNYINRLRTFKFIFISSITAYISTIPFSIIAYYINNNSGLNINIELPLVINLLIINFFIPIMESIMLLLIIVLVLQSIGYFLLRRMFL